MRRLPFLLLMSLVLTVGVASYLVWRNRPDNIVTPEQQPVTEQINSECDLAKQTCIAQFADLQVQAALPQPPVYLKPFVLTVHTRGRNSAAITAVRAQFVMTDMQMPTPVTSLVPTISADNRDPSWQGNAILPVCISGRHDWRVVIELETATMRYRVQYGMSMARVR